MSAHLIEPGTPCGIEGADLVWASGGRVYIIDVAVNPATGRKYSTTDIVEGGDRSVPKKKAKKKTKRTMKY